MPSKLINIGQLKTSLQAIPLPTKVSELLNDANYITANDIPIESDTTANWNAKITYAPPKGTIIIYEDYAQDSDDNDVPNFKVGDGNAYVVDLPFVGDDLREAFQAHIQDTDIHVTLQEKSDWNDKVRCYVDIVSDEILVFTTD